LLKAGDSNDSILSTEGESARPPPPAAASTTNQSSAGSSNNADASANQSSAAADASVEPQPGCSHWTEDNNPSSNTTAATAAAESGTASPLQRVSSSSAAPIDWEGMYNDLYARHASLIARLQVRKSAERLFAVFFNVWRSISLAPNLNESKYQFSLLA
jgi:hypothetical protein